MEFHIKFLIASLRNGFRFPAILNKQLFEKYLGQAKIIAWHKGYPMYTTISPMSLSPPFANKMTTFIMSVLQNRPLPHILDFAVTDKCNCNCAHCAFANKKKSLPELKTAIIKKIIKDSIDLGVSSINIVGGEPLLRKDILEIIKSIDKNKSICSIFTNGWLLKEYAKELKKAGLTTVKVSIDSPYAPIHDAIRRKKGLFDKAIEGIKEAKKIGLITGISCCITKKELDDGSFEKLILLGKKLKVNEIWVFDALPVGNYAHRANLREDPPLLGDILNIVKKYNKNPKFPGFFVYSFVRNPKSMGCAGGISYFYIDPYANVYPCDFHKKSYGNLKKEPLHLIWNKMASERNCSSYCGCEIRKN